MAQEVQQSCELEALRALDEARAALKEVRQNTTETLMNELRKQCQKIDVTFPISPSESNSNTRYYQELTGPEDEDNNQSLIESSVTKSEEELIALSKVVEANLSSEHHEKTVSVLSMAERRIVPEQASKTVDLTSSSLPLKNESETTSSQTTDHHKKKWYSVRKFFAKLKSNKNS